MKTSHQQFELMVDFMERNGDLCKPTGGARGRQWCIMKWKELATKLNSEGTGHTRSEEQWRKVWSDYKNNTKRKWAKIKRGAHGTGGGPALKISMTDLELRVMTIMGEEAAVGIDVPEAGFAGIVDEEQEPDIVVIEVEGSANRSPFNDMESAWNMPSTSSQPTPSYPIPTQEPPISSTLPPSVSELQWKPPKKKTRVDEAAKAFLNADKKARELERERDQWLVEQEKERTRQRDVELQLQARLLSLMEEWERERRRQRDVELQLQARLLSLMEHIQAILKQYLEKGE